MNNWKEELKNKWYKGEFWLNDKDAVDNIIKYIQTNFIPKEEINKALLDKCKLAGDLKDHPMATVVKISDIREILNLPPFKDPTSRESKEEVVKSHDFVPTHPDSGGKNDWCKLCGKYEHKHNSPQPPQIEEKCKDCSTYRKTANNGTRYLCNHFSEYCRNCEEWKSNK